MTKIFLPSRRLKLAFFGTPEIAQTVLEMILRTNEDDVCMVVSQPDRLSGRGRKDTKAPEPTPVKATALKYGIECFQPERLKDARLENEMIRREVDLAIVIAYGKIIPRAVYEAPKYKTWNIHASLLPKFRGASPIAEAILKNEQKTGVTIMEINDRMDEGDMLFKASLLIEPEDTTASLTQRLAELGGKTILQVIHQAKDQSLGLMREKQDDSKASYAPLRKKMDGLLSVNQSARDLSLAVRAFYPWPSVTMDLGYGPIKLIKVKEVDIPLIIPTGSLKFSGDQLLLGTSPGVLELIEVQPPGKRPMSGADYARGLRLIRNSSTTE